MSRFPEANLEKITTQPIEKRQSKVNVDVFAREVSPDMASILDAFPNLLAGESLRKAIAATARAARNKKPVVAMIGGHVIKTGCGPLLIQLIRKKVVTAVAMNGAAAIHDYEVARFGQTSEDVDASLGAGTFGMAGETSQEMNRITGLAVERDMGFGEALGHELDQTQAVHGDLSVLVEAFRNEIPVTVHVALGTDILHQHKSADGAAIGAASLKDFRILAGVMETFSGGVALNVGSAVILPEVFLKAFSIAANLGADLNRITTINFDFIRHYRPRVNIVERPTASGRGKGYEITGHHEILLPLFTAGVLRELLSTGSDQ